MLCKETYSANIGHAIIENNVGDRTYNRRICICFSIFSSAQGVRKQGEEDDV
jgi:hypothetical protein